MSFSSAPDARTLGRVAGALALDEAFVEKDWFVVEAIRVLMGQATTDLMPVFSGGTSLLKGYGLIKRFSEDLDFKLVLSDAFVGQSNNQQRKALGTFRDALVGAWEAAGFEITHVEARDGNGFIKVEMDYPSAIRHESLRPHIQAEISAKPPRLAVQDRELASFVAQYRQLSPEVPSIPCVDPVETAADKLSAFAWRAIVRERGSKKDDPTIVRHVHDLALLESIASEDARFGGLLNETLVADSARGNGAVAHLPPKDRLAAMLAKLAEDDGYEGEYARFVEAMAFGGALPDFAAATAALDRLSAQLPN
jgi:predicted nucleotidyltransferase component of viral defense system